MNFFFLTFLNHTFLHLWPNMMFRGHICAIFVPQMKKLGVWYKLTKHKFLRYLLETIIWQNSKLQHSDIWGLHQFTKENEYAFFFTL